MRDTRSQDRITDAEDGHVIPISRCPSLEGPLLHVARDRVLRARLFIRDGAPSRLFQRWLD
jgi:hypothetical protein